MEEELQLEDDQQGARGPERPLCDQQRYLKVQLVRDAQPPGSRNGPRLKKLSIKLATQISPFTVR
jgi:hypothetical protein